MKIETELENSEAQIREGLARRFRSSVTISIGLTLINLGDMQWRQFFKVDGLTSVKTILTDVTIVTSGSRNSVDNSQFSFDCQVIGSTRPSGLLPDRILDILVLALPKVEKLGKVMSYGDLGHPENMINNQ